MLRFIRDLVFPKAYDFSARTRGRRSEEARPLPRRESPDQGSAGQSETATAASTGA